MDIKEIGVCGAVVVGGAFYGVTQLGLNDVLAEELSHISEVSYQERPAYMEGVVSEFTEAFDTYSVQTETYLFVGESSFKALPKKGAFIETVKQNEPVPASEAKTIKAQMESLNFCEEAEMVMFTEKGWAYQFRMEDSKNRKIFSIVCHPAENLLRGLS